MSHRSVSHSRVVEATPDRVFDILADPRKHPLIDGSGSVKSTLSAPERLALGSSFGMRMHLLTPYVIRNTVVEFEENRRIAWRHFNGHRWRYELEADGPGRTIVTETFDWSTARMPWVLELMGFPDRNSAAIVQTLERLADLVSTTDKPG